jgi:hypothetical protein
MKVDLTNFDVLLIYRPAWGYEASLRHYMLLDHYTNWKCCVTWLGLV